MLEPLLAKVPPLRAQGLWITAVYSNVHSLTFPAKSYIFIFLHASLAPVVNNIELLLELAESFVLFPFAYVTQFANAVL